MTVIPKILVVDDDAAHRLMLKTVLADDGYDITEAEDGAEAVAAVESRFYDLILLVIGPELTSSISWKLPPAGTTVHIRSSK